MISTDAPLAESPVPLLSRGDAGNAAREVRRGVLARVTRGVYAPADAWARLAPWERYLARVHAVAQVYPDAVFVLESGCALRGMPVFGEPPDVHVLLPSPAKSQSLAGIRVHTTERMPQAERVDGIRVVAPAELSVGIARLRHPAVGLAVTNAALRSDAALTVADLKVTSARRPTARGVLALGWVLDRATAVAESTLESVSMAVLEWAGFPAPVLQQPFLGAQPGDDDRVDFWWPEWGVAGEADGAVKYSGELGDARAALRARNARDARLAERGVRATAHWSLQDLTSWAQVRALLTAAGLPRVRPEQTPPLDTLGRALRGHPLSPRALWR